MANDDYYIPHGQDTFFSFSQMFVAAVKAYAADLNLSTAVINALDAGQTFLINRASGFPYEEDLAALVAAPHDHANTVARQALLRKRTKEIADFYNQYIRYNPALTATIKTAITGVAPDENSTPFDVKDHEVGVLITPDGPAQLKLTFFDLETNAKKILPGMGGIVACNSALPNCLEFQRG